MDLTLVEATIYDNITEENGRGEVLDALRTLKARVAELEEKNEILSDALQLIISGDGVYGKQAAEYKSIARVALSKAQS